MQDLHGGIEKCVLIVRFQLPQGLRRNPAIETKPDYIDSVCRAQ
jgi:hypothetical protein